MRGYATRNSDFNRVSYSDKCEGCGGDHGCTYVISEGKRISLCVRDRSTGRLASDGRGIHITDESGYKPILTPPRPIPATIQRRDSVYRAMLERLTLEDRDFQHLFRRGLTKEQIGKLAYKTTADVAEGLTNFGYILDRVPGFYKENGTPKTNIREGFFVPCLDLQGRITALQIRTYSEKYKYVWFSSYLKVLSDGTKELLPFGASSGSPVHFKQGTKTGLGTDIWITEGLLKADIINLLTGWNVLAIAGAAASHDEVAQASLDYKRIIIAMDTDWHDNKDVRKQMIRLYKNITKRSGIPVKIATWPDYKGLDEALINNTTKLVISNFEDVIELPN